MSAPFRTTTQEKVDTFAGEADRLFWMLDSLRSRTNDFLLIESVADPSRFVQASRQDDGVCVLEVKEGAAGPLRGARAADVLDVHQAILAWTRRDSAWESGFTWRELREDNGYRIGDAAVRPVADEPADYAATGLSIQDAMLHRAKIDRQLGRLVLTPPIVTWGAYLVRTGDIITGIAERGAVTVSPVSASPAYRQGVMLVAGGGASTGFVDVQNHWALGTMADPVVEWSFSRLSRARLGPGRFFAGPQWPRTPRTARSFSTWPARCCAGYAGSRGTPGVRDDVVGAASRPGQCPTRDDLDAGNMLPHDGRDQHGVRPGNRLRRARSVLRDHDSSGART